MPIVLILEALAKAAIKFYVATKVAISIYTLYKIGSKIYEEICDAQ